MKSTAYTGQLGQLINMATQGTREAVDRIMELLTSEATLVLTRNVDFALSLVNSNIGISRIEYYLFNGTKIQRNYACLFFARRRDWNVVNRAYEKGLVDELQAYSR
jgi:hypothetical protein